MVLGRVRVPAPAAQAPPWQRIGEPAGPLDRLRDACGGRHELLVRRVPVDEYARSGLPTTTMGRALADDRLFFEAALASGDALAATVLEEAQ